MIYQGHRKNVVITGGMGFIGSHLVDALYPLCNTIYVIDNMESNAVSISYAREKSQVFLQSVESFDFNRINFDILFHLASPVGPTGVLKWAGDMAETMVSSTVKVRDACIRKDVPLVLISSSEIYGHAGELHEKAVKIFPSEYSVRSEYGAAKMLSEIAIVNKAKVTDLKYLIIRPFNVAGPRQLPDNGFVLPRFIHQALRNDPITVYGDGLQKRAFTDVRDIVSCILFLCSLGEWGETYNIGNPANEITIESLAWRVINILGNMGVRTNSEIAYIDPKSLHGDLFEEVPDKLPQIEKFKKFGIKMAYELDTTIIDAIKHIVELKWQLW